MSRQYMWNLLFCLKLACTLHKHLLKGKFLQYCLRETPCSDICCLPIAPASLPQSQVFLSHFQCECGAFHIRLTASDTVQPFTFLTLAPAKHSSTLLIQFDGSARQSEKIGGAGVVALQVTPDSISVVSWHAFALPSCKDNIYAEAFACLEALRISNTHIETALASGRPAPHITVQGDILPVVNFLTFRGRFRRLDVLPLLEQCLSLLSKMPRLQLEYRPRECNQFADHCAGLGTKATSTQNLSQISPVHVDPPYELCMRVTRIFHS